MWWHEFKTEVPQNFPEVQYLSKSPCFKAVHSSQVLKEWDNFFLNDTFLKHETRINSLNANKMFWSKYLDQFMVDSMKAQAHTVFQSPWIEF